MKLHQVPILNDYPEYRGNFIQSKASCDMAFLDPNGKMILLNRAVAGAVLCMFDEMSRRYDQIPLTKFICYAERVKKIFVAEEKI
jgi:hypothetical protein